MGVVRVQGPKLNFKPPSVNLQLVLGWVTVRGYTILVFNQKRRVLRNSGPVPKLLAYWHSWLKALVAMGLAIRVTCVVC